MSKVIGFVIGVAQFAFGVYLLSTGNVPMGLTLMSSGGLTIMGQFQLNSFQQGIKSNVTSTQAALPVIYGETRVGHSNVDIRAKGDDNHRLHIVAAICVASENGKGIQEIDDIYFNGELAVNNPTFPTDVLGGVLVGVTDAFAHGSEKFIRYALHAGLDSPSVDSTMNDRFSSAWPSTSVGSGIAYAMMRLKYDKADEDKIFATGIPKIEYLIRGNRLFDPRWPTNGPDGDGYVFLESDTDASIDYNPGQNPGLALYDYLKSSKYGMNIPLSRLNEQSFIDLAEHCDEHVNPASLGNQARYTVNGALSTGDSHKTNIEKILSACNSNLIWIGGEIVVQPRKSTTAETFELNEDNILGGISVVRSGVDIPNTITAKFPDAANDWSVMDVVWPELGSNAFLTTDNNQESLIELDFPLTTNYHTAQQLAMIAVKELRQDVAIELTATEDALVLLTGDIVKLTYDTAGFTAKEFRVMGMEIKDDSTIGIQLREYDTNVYDLDVQVVQPTVPGTDHPDPSTTLPPTNMTLLSDNTTALHLADGTVLPRVYCTWDQSLDSFLEKETVQWRVGTDAFKDLAAPRVTDAVAGQQEIYSPAVEEGEVVHFNIRAVNSLGVASAVLTGSLAASGKDVPPADVTGFTALLGPNGVYRLGWNAVSDADLSHYQVRYGGASWAAATILGDRIDSNLWAFIASDLGSAARSTTIRVKAFDRSGNESANDATVALADPAPVAVSPTSTLVRNGIITVTVNTTTTESSGMRLYASTTASFTADDSNRVAGVGIPEDGLGAQDISFALPLAFIGVTVYMRLGFVDALTVPLAESESLSSEFTDTGVDPDGSADTNIPSALVFVTNPGEITLTVQDDSGFLTGIGFLKYEFGVWDTAWTDDTSVPFDLIASVAIEEKRDTAIGWRLIYDAGSGERFSGGVVTFDADTAPEISFLTLDVTDTGATEARFGVDDDVGSVRHAESTSAYPTEATTRTGGGSTLIDMTGKRTDTFDPGSITEGQTRYVTMFAYSDTAGLNDESAIFYQIKTTRPTDTVPSNLPEITALSLIVRNTGIPMFHFAGNEHVVSIGWAERDESDGAWASEAAAFADADASTDYVNAQSGINVIVNGGSPIAEGDTHYIAVVAYTATSGGGTISEVAYTDEAVRPTDTDTLPDDPEKTHSGRLINGGFELGDKTGWESAESGVVVNVPGDGHNSSDYVMEVSSGAGGPNQMSLPIAIGPGRKLSVSGWARRKVGDLPDADGFLRIRTYNESDAQQQSINLATFDKDTAGWQVGFGRLLTAATVSYFKVDLGESSGTTGEWQYDDIAEFHVAEDPIGDFSSFIVDIDHATGNVDVSYVGNIDWLASRIATNGSAFPSEATTQAATPIRTNRVEEGLNLGNIAEGASLFVTAFGYNATAAGATDGRSQLYSAMVSRSTDTIVQIPTLQVIPTVSSGTAKLELIPSNNATVDEGDFTLPFRFRHSTPQLGPGTWSTWADENGAPYEHSTSLLEKHNLIIEWEATYDLGLGDGAEILQDSVTYDTDTTPELKHIGIDQDAGVPTITWGGDDDTERVRWAEATDAAFPSKNDAETSGNTETARSFTVGSITQGQTKRVTVVAERTTAPAGFGVEEYQVEVTMPPDTDTLPSNLPEITSFVPAINHDTGECTYSWSGNEFVNSIRRIDDDTGWTTNALAKTAAEGSSNVDEGQSGQDLQFEPSIAEGDTQFISIVAYPNAAGGGTPSEVAYTGQVTRATDTDTITPPTDLPGSSDAMILNGDFQHATDGAFWAVRSGFSGTVDIESGSPLIGTQSLRIVSNTGGTDGDVYASIDGGGFVTASDANRRWIPVSENDNFLIVSTLKSQSNHPIRVRVLEVDGSYGSDNNVVIQSHQSTSALVYRDAYTVPSGVVYVCFFVSVDTDSSGPRNYYADGLMIRRWYSDTSGIPIVGGMATGATFRLDDDTLPKKNFRLTATADDGAIWWGGIAWQLVHPNGHKLTVSVDQSTRVSHVTGDLITATATLAYVGGDESRFTALSNAEQREIVRVRSTRTYGWEYMDETGWQSFTLDEDDVIIAMCDIDLTGDVGDVLDVGMIGLDGATVIESIDGAIPQGTPAEDGAGPKTLPKGMNTGSIHHKTGVTFADAYNSAPTVIYSTGGATAQKDNKWGTKQQVDDDSGNTGSEPTNTAIYQDAGFQVTAAGFTPLLYLRDGPSVTPRDTDMAEDTSLTASPTCTGDANMAISGEVPAFDDKYRIAYDITIEYNKQGAKSCTVTMEGRLNGASFTEIASVTVNTTLDIGGGFLFGSGTLVGTFAGFDGTGNDDLQCCLKSVGGSGIIDIDVFFGTGSSGGIDVRWNTSASTYASMTPLDEDEIIYFVQADVGQAEA